MTQKLQNLNMRATEREYSDFQNHIKQIQKHFYIVCGFKFSVGLIVHIAVVNWGIAQKIDKKKKSGRNSQ